MFETHEQHFPVAFGFVAGEVDENLAERISGKNLELIERAEAEGQPFFFFINALGVGGVTPPARKHMAEWDAGLSEEQAQRMAARVILSDSLVVRGAISAMSWFSPRMRSVLTAKSFEEGVERLREVMHERGQILSEETVESLRQANARAEGRHRSS